MRAYLAVALTVVAVAYLCGYSAADDVSGKGLIAMAQKLYIQGNLSEAATLAGSGLKKVDRPGRINQVDAVKAMRLVASIKADQGKLSDARMFQARARAAGESLFGPDHPVTIGSAVTLANLDARMGRRQSAEELYKNAIAVYSRAGREDDVTIAPALEGLAQIKRTEGKDTEAEALYQRAVNSYEKLTKYRPYLNEEVAQIFVRMADLHKERGEHALAAAGYRKALERADMVKGTTNMDTADTMVRLGDTYVTWGKPARAERQYKKALAIYQVIGGNNDLKAAVTMKRIGDLQRIKGNTPKAERLYVKTLAMLDQCSPTCDSTMASTMKALADLRMTRGDHATALPLYKSVLATMK